MGADITASNHLTPGLPLDVNALPLHHGAVAAGQVAGGAPTTAALELGVFGGLEFGAWEMGAGAMFDVEADEVFIVTAGAATVRIEAFGDSPETTVVLAAGSLMRLSAGMRTEWTVTDTLRKLYLTPER
ncbi:cupin domain-containing protein [Specibacter cremeus]|uniref:cupin domain-containing protein n=1 Tax=Specibacter cremeus TaxID=1629051 RepID=UPI000F7AF344|nr:cupin domain-containing protein [Specibacter cremeus]